MNVYKENFTSFFHWFAWTISIVASLFFILFDVRENLTFLIRYHQLSLIPLLIVLIIAISGTIYSLFRQVNGGVLMITGGLGIIIYYYFHGGIREFPMMIAYGLPYIIPGVFFVFVRK